MRIVHLACARSHAIAQRLRVPPSRTQRQRRRQCESSTAVEGPAAPSIQHQRPARQQGRDPPVVQGRRRNRAAWAFAKVSASAKGERLAEIEQTEINAQVEQARQAHREGRARRRARRAAVRRQVISLEQLQDLRTQAAVAEAGVELRGVQLELRCDRRAARWRRSCVASPRNVNWFGRQSRARARRGGSRLHRAHWTRRSRNRPGEARRRGGDPTRCAAAARRSREGDGSSERGRRCERHVRHRGLGRSRRSAAQERPRRKAVASCLRPPAPAHASTCRSARSSKATARRARLRARTTAARRRDVEVAFIEGERVALASGLEAGEQVITDGAQYLEDGEAVAIVDTRGRQAGESDEPIESREAAVMSLLEFPIKRYQFTLVAFALLVALECQSFRNIPRQEDPYFPISMFQIIVVYPGAEPQDVERLVVKPIEDRLSELDDIKKIESDSNDGVAVDRSGVLRLRRRRKEIRRGRPRDQCAAADAAAGARAARNQEDQPRARQYRAVRARLRRRAVSRARGLRSRSEGPLKTLDGVRTSETWAYPARELRVALDLPRMAELRLAPGRVIQALQNENADVPGGSIDIGSRSFSLKTSGSYESLDEVRNTVVAAVDGRSVRVRDIAEVSWNTQEHTLRRPLQRQARRVRHGQPEGRLQHLRRAGAHSGGGGTLRGAAAQAHLARARLRSIRERRDAPRSADDRFRDRHRAGRDHAAAARPARRRAS